MKCVRIKLTQNSANYKQPECIDNKMTYPLPPVSTVIGALHNACGYKQYMPMDISVQGGFESLHREPYTDNSVLNIKYDDRGTLIKLVNPQSHAAGFLKVAATKSRTASFKNRVDLDVFDKELLQEYIDLTKEKDAVAKFKREKFKQLMGTIRKRKKSLTEKRKNYDKKSEEYLKIDQKITYYKEKEQEFKQAMGECEKNIEHSLSFFASHVTSIKYYEILNNISLVIHIRADENILNDIVENIGNLTAIGRSEDFVDVQECKIVEVNHDIDKYDLDDISCETSAYINVEDVNSNVEESNIQILGQAGRTVNGTVYYMNKNYQIIEGKRIFEKKKVLYASNFYIDDVSPNIWLDCSDEKQYIVNFI